jgi:hypothetical protein
LLLHHCLHYCFHLIQGSPSMVQLADLLAVCQPTGLQWPIFVERTNSYQAAPYALAALTLAHKLLAAPIPDTTLQQLNEVTPAAMQPYIAALDLAYILERSQQKPLVTVRQRLQRGWQDRAETARWAVNWHGRLQVWRTLFQPTRTDTGQIILQHMRDPS